MDIMEFTTRKLGWLPPALIRFIEKHMRKIPAVQRILNTEYDAVMGDMENSLNPYGKEFSTYKSLPKDARSQEDILMEMKKYTELEEKNWKEGYASGAVYQGDSGHIDFLNKVYALHSQSNPLHVDMWPSAAKFEAEIVSMTAAMFNGDKMSQESSMRYESKVCGTVTSGGTESILLAMKTYRDWARETKGIRHPEMIIPSTAHAAFDKAAHYFKIKKIVIPVDENYQVDIKKVKRAINRRTIVIVGSTPAFPHGIIDPIEELSELAYKHHIACHVDACLGGFIIPWAKKLGYTIPEFDFKLRGVTSISADTHKYGYAAKGTSVILYRSEALRHFQYYTVGDWPGGLYMSPTFAGSRPGALSAACWAAMVSTGESGYLSATKEILETGEKIKQGIQAIPELTILGNPLWVIAFSSKDLNIYRVLDEMNHLGWSLNGLHHPSAIHIALTLRHTQAGVADRFLNDLKTAVDIVKEYPSEKGNMAPVYGMAASMPFKGVISDILKRYLDAMYKVKE